ncbi:MAG: GAF domain-containing protein, partial [Pseudomonadota bacterium]
MIDTQGSEERSVARADEKSSCGDPENYAPLVTVLANAELYEVTSRQPDYAVENRALTTLVTALAEAPESLLQTLTDTTLDLFKVGSAGISLLSKDQQNFFWPAISGVWKPHIGGGTPRHFGPCGDVLDANRALVFLHPEKRYTYLLEAVAVPAKCLLVPFYSGGNPVGTIWIVSHDDSHRFDAEDLRLLESIARFASAAFKVVQTSTSLRESEQRFSGFVTASTDMVFRMSPDWREMRQLVGHDFTDSTEELKHRWLDEYVDPADHQEVSKVIREAIHARHKVEMVNRVRRVDGSFGWTQWNAIPLLSDKGEIVEWIGSAVDVTEARKIADALRDSEERYRNLFNSMDEGYCIIEMLF